SATASASSASSSKTQADKSAASATQAATSRDAAKGSADAAAGSASAAKTSETNAAQSSSTANTHRAAAEQAKNAADASKSAAATSASAASSSASKAATSATNAAKSETDAESHASDSLKYATQSEEARDESRLARDEAVAAAENAQQGAPADGWKKSELAQPVQDSLSRADTALQSIPVATSSAPGAIRLTGDLGGTAQSPTVPGLAGKANTSHTHTQAQVTGLSTALNGKADKSHTHVSADISNTTSELMSRNPNRVVRTDADGAISIHNHTITGDYSAANKAYVDGEVAKKANTSHTHTTSQISGLGTALNGKADKSYVESRPALFSGSGAPPTSIP